MNIIAIANQKGGVGKTTTTINLGAALSALGKRVLLVDLDPQANTTSGLGELKTHNPSVYELLFEPEKVREAIVEVSGMSLIPGKPDLAAAEVELVQEMAREQRLKQLLSQVEFDYVIIDCPPSLGLLTVNALTAATDVIIPVQAEYYALEGLSQLINTIQRVRQALNPKLRIMGVLMTMVDARTSLSSEVTAQVKQHFGKSVFDVQVPRNVRLAEAPSHGRSAVEHDKWSKGARAYKQLAKEVANRG